jgi:hypothetical protein
VKFLLGEESGCVSPIESEEVPENPSMEEAITEAGRGRWPRQRAEKAVCGAHG